MSIKTRKRRTRLKIPQEIHQEVNLNAKGFSTDNNGKSNTINFLKMYLYCREKHFLVGSLPEKMINMSGLKNKNKFINMNNYEIVELIEKELSPQTTYKISETITSANSYQVASKIYTMIRDAVKYLYEHDINGELILHLFSLVYASPATSYEDKKAELANLLKRQAFIGDRSFYTYKKYTIYRIDEYLYSPKNKYLDFMLDYISSHTKETREYGENN